MAKIMVNRRAGRCERCGADVPAGKGFAATRPSGGWMVLCAEHGQSTATAARQAEQTAAAAPKRVEVRPHTDAGRITAEPLDRLNGAWGGYLAACKATPGYRNRKLPTGQWDLSFPAASLEALISELQRIKGLTVVVTEELRELALDAAGRQAAIAEAARNAVVRADAQMALVGGSLYPFQRQGIKWLASMEGALLADEMGTGKTIQSIFAALAAIDGTEGGIVVLCPKTLVRNWINEFARWAPSVPTFAAKGRKGARAFRAPRSGEVVVANYEITPATCPALPAGTVVICDEAHLCKNPKAQRTVRARAIARAARDGGGRAWVLTATPLKNRQPDLYHVLQLAGCCPWPSFGAFARDAGGYLTSPRWARGRKVWQWDGAIKPACAESLSRVMLRRVKADVLADMPEKRHEQILVNDLDAATRRELDAAAEALAALGVDLDDCTAQALESAAKLPGFEDLSKARALLAAAKLPHAISIIESHEQADEPLVVFSDHRAPIDAIGEREGWATLTGEEQDSDKRAAVVEAFQAGELKGVACTVRAAGVGITLTRANRALFLDLSWSPSDVRQAEDRIHRIGQDRGTLITWLVADHAIDRAIAAAIDHKEEMQDEIVEAACARTHDEPARKVSPVAGLATADEIAAGPAPAFDLDAHLAALDAECQAYAADCAAADEAAKRATSRRIDTTGLDNETRREACSTVEAWAAAAITDLAALDRDRASVRNHMGFNKADGKYGHALAQRLAGEGLTELEWHIAIKIASGYPRQVGTKPATDGEK